MICPKSRKFIMPKVCDEPIIHFINEPHKIPVFRENLEIARSIIETAMPDADQNGTLRFRRGSTVASFDHHRIMLQRQIGAKLQESFQCCFSFGDLRSPFAGKPKNQASAVASIEFFSGILDEASLSTRVGDPQQLLPPELEEIFAICGLAAIMEGADTDDEILLALPNPLMEGSCPLALVEISHEQFQLCEATYSRVSAELPPAVYHQIMEFTDCGTKAISWDLFSLDYTKSVGSKVNIVDQMKAMAKYRLVDDDIKLIPFEAESNLANSA